MRTKRRLIIASIVALGTVPAAALTSAQVTQEQVGYAGSPSIAAARDLYQRSLYAEARTMLDALITAGGVDAEILFYRGLVEPDATVAVERFFIEVIRRWPGGEWSDRARFRIAQFRYDTGYYLAARDLFGQVAWHQGDTALGQDARYWRGMTYLYSIGRSDAAPDSIRIGLRAVKAVAGSATVPAVKGQAIITSAELHLILGEPDSTLVWTARALEAPYLNDYHPRALLLQAQARDRLDEVDLARPLYQAVSTRYPDTLEGREARRWLTENRERLVQARLDTMAAAEARTLETTGQGLWTIQVGAYSRLANASSVVVSLGSRGYHAWHTSKRVEGSVFVVVNVGRFATRAEATAFRQELITGGVLETSSFVAPIPPG